MINADQIVDWIKRSGQVISENKDTLTELDSLIGDADHGINMDRGFKKVLSQLPSVEKADIGAILRMVGMALITSVGGASGPLYGSFFMEAAKAAGGKRELTDADVVVLFEAGLKGVVRLGKAALGDKTMVDALQPGVDALKQKVEAGSTTAEAVKSMVQAVKSGMEGTVPLIAKKGRASYLGERSAGHQDPGATSAYLMINALLDVVSA